MIFKIIYDIWLSWDLIVIEPPISYYSHTNNAEKYNLAVPLNHFSVTYI